jgi:membrane-associated phospholipid phosphatase
MNISNIISISTLVVYILPTVLYIITKKSYHLTAFVGLIAVSAINEHIKHKWVGYDSPRPQGAFDCDLLCSNGNQEGNPGMPSGHTSTAVFFAVFYWRYTTNPTIHFILISYAILVALSRYMKRCHTIPQIMMGALLGFGMNAAFK